MRAKSITLLGEREREGNRKRKIQRMEREG